MQRRHQRATNWKRSRPGRLTTGAFSLIFEKTYKVRRAVRETVRLTTGSEFGYSKFGWPGRLTANFFFGPARAGGDQAGKAVDSQFVFGPARGQAGKADDSPFFSGRGV